MKIFSIITILLLAGCNDGQRAIVDYGPWKSQNRRTCLIDKKFFITVIYGGKESRDVLSVNIEKYNPDDQSQNNDLYYTGESAKFIGNGNVLEIVKNTIIWNSRDGDIGLYEFRRN